MKGCKRGIGNKKRAWVPGKVQKKKMKLKAQEIAKGAEKEKSGVLEGGIGPQFQSKRKSARGKGVYGKDDK